MVLKFFPENLPLKNIFLVSSHHIKFQIVSSPTIYTHTYSDGSTYKPVVAYARQV